MALETKLVELGSYQQPGVDPTMRDMASRAFAGLHHRVGKGERPLLVRVTGHATPARHRLQTPLGLFGSMGRVTITALHHPFPDGVMKRKPELSRLAPVAFAAEIELRLAGQ